MLYKLYSKSLYPFCFVRFKIHHQSTEITLIIISIIICSIKILFILCGATTRKPGSAFNDITQIRSAYLSM